MLNAFIRLCVESVEFHVFFYIIVKKSLPYIIMLLDVVNVCIHSKFYQFENRYHLTK